MKYTNTILPPLENGPHGILDVSFIATSRSRSATSEISEDGPARLSLPSSAQVSERARRAAKRRRLENDDTDAHSSSVPVIDVENTGASVPATDLAESFDEDLLANWTSVFQKVVKGKSVTDHQVCVRRSSCLSLS